MTMERDSETNYTSIQSGNKNTHKIVGNSVFKKWSSHVLISCIFPASMIAEQLSVRLIIGRS